VPATLRIATRASPLALWQAQHVADLLTAVAPGTKIDIVHVTTTGDRDRTAPLRTYGGVGVFTREIQAAVLDSRADLAVHSLKDLPSDSAAGMCLAAVPEREETADALVLPENCTGEATLEALKPAARIGTGSPRRRAQLLHLRPDLTLEEVRGNIETRLRKLDAGEYDALVLAAAGLKRLGLVGRVSRRLVPPAMFPAVGQGALGIECRDGAADESLRDLLRRVDDPSTRACVTAERSLMSRLQAGCHAPVGAATRVESGVLTLEAVVLSADGRQRLVAQRARAASEAAALGAEVAELLFRQGAAPLMGL
jgi:hydroxymethylbilane synthase